MATDQKLKGSPKRGDGGGEGFLLPMAAWILERLYTFSLCRILNSTVNKPWVSEAYCSGIFLLGVVWLMLVELPILTGRVWIVLGVALLLYWSVELLVFSLKWALVDLGPLVSYRRSLVCFVMNLLEVAVFFTIVLWLVEGYSQPVSRWMAFCRNLGSVFTFTPAGGLKDDSLGVWILTLLQLGIAWVLVVLLLGHVIGAITRGEKGGYALASDPKDRSEHFRPNSDIAKKHTTLASENENETESPKLQGWLKNLVSPVVVGLVVLGGQIFINPIVAKRVKIQESVMQKRYEACETAIQLLQRRLASATWTGAEVPEWYTPPEKNPPSQLELNVAYNLLLIYGESQTIAQEFFDATSSGKTKPADIVRFLSAVRKELGVDEKDSIHKVQYSFLRPVTDNEQTDNKAKDGGDPQ